MNNRRITLMRPSQIFDSFLDDFWNPNFRTGTSNIQMNMSEDQDNVYLEAKIPGFKKDDIDISIEDGIVTISGTAKVETEDKDEKRSYHMHEISEESFTRSVTLPRRVDADNSNAEFSDGMLNITLPKLAESRAKKLEIKE